MGAARPREVHLAPGLALALPTAAVRADNCDDGQAVEAEAPAPPIAAATRKQIINPEK